MSLGNFVKTIQNIMRGDSGINGDAQRIEQMTWLLFLKVYDTKEEDWEFHDDDYEKNYGGEIGRLTIKMERQ